MISAGRLEVFVDHQWGTVCDDFFDAIDTFVACQQLGYSRIITNGNVNNLGWVHTYIIIDRNFREDRSPTELSRDVLYTLTTCGTIYTCSLSHVM